MSLEDFRDPPRDPEGAAERWRELQAKHPKGVPQDVATVFWRSCSAYGIADEVDRALTRQNPQ